MEKKRMWEKKPTSEMYTSHPHKKKRHTLQYIVYSIAHRSYQCVKILSVCVASQKTDPSCAVLRKVSTQKGSCKAEAEPSPFAVKEDEHTLIT